MIEKLERLVDEVGALQSKLVLLIGPSNAGKTALLQATLAQNWSAALLLLEHGADWRQVRALDGRDFRSMLEDDARTYGEQPGLAEVRRFHDEAQAKSGRH